MQKNVMERQNSETPNCIKNQRDLEKLYVLYKVFWKLLPQIIPVNIKWTLIQSYKQRQDHPIEEFRDKLSNTFRQNPEVIADTEGVSS